MSSTALVLLCAFPSALAWGNFGHETIAYIAQNFVTADTKTWAQDILDDTSTSYLANVATWADSFRETTAGKFSAPFHFIDANDDPPTSCNVDFDRDCGSTGCVVSAIQNYTARVQKTSLSSTEINDALRFIVHFVGDIHQPLHDEAFEVGGNDVDVTFNGASTNLHAIWDTQMPEKIAGSTTLSGAKSWASTLTTEIKSGSFESDKDSWLDGIKLSDPVGTATGWASDSNAFVCSVVMPNGIAPLEKGDLDTTYFNSAVSTIELQIARAGYRLAAWLNLIAGGTTGGLKVRNAKRAEGPVVSVAPNRQRDWRDALAAREAWGGGGCGCGHAH